MIKSTQALALAALLALAPQASAGVRGNNFAGTYTCDNGNTADPAVLSFDQVGSRVRLGYRFGAGTGMSTGSYSEIDLLLLSVWSMELSPTESASGVSFFGAFTTMDASFGNSRCRGFFTRSSMRPEDVMANAPSTLSDAGVGSWTPGAPPARVASLVGEPVASLRRSLPAR